MDFNGNSRTSSFRDLYGLCDLRCPEEILGHKSESNVMTFSLSLCSPADASESADETLHFASIFEALISIIIVQPTCDKFLCRLPSNDDVFKDGFVVSSRCVNTIAESRHKKRQRKDFILLFSLFFKLSCYSQAMRESNRGENCLNYASHSFRSCSPFCSLRYIGYS